MKENNFEDNNKAESQEIKMINNDLIQQLKSANMKIQKIQKIQKKLMII